MRFAFVAFLAITLVMCGIVNVGNVEAKRVLSEETPQVVVLHHNEALQQVEKREGLGCDKGCELICFPDPVNPSCRCIC
ncbi:uncharacterized protein LOC17890934 [Capsella rubella]|nr:uncharacterized protein LOC17890934 [Capsella rubella]